MKTTLK